MKNLIRVSLLAALAALAAFGQANTLGKTTLSGAITSSANTLVVASATGIAVTGPTTNGAVLYIQDIGQTKGELAFVTSVSSTTIGVRRGMNGTKAVAHASGAMVLVGAPGLFYSTDPQGSCTAASTLVTPYVNVLTGVQHVCSTITLTWVPGWGNPNPPQATILVASAAGATAVNSPLQHINGTNAITAFTMSAGWNGQGFCIIPDAAFTTTATSNIAKASTAVANKTLCFAWDATNSLFTPNY